MTVALLVALLVLALLAVATLRAVRAPSRTALAGCVVLAVLWLVVNKPLEGPLLLGLGDGHGVTLGDVLSVAAVLAAALAALRRRLEHRAAQGDAEPVRAGRGTTRTGR